jgi:putative NADH-flavin reductase
MENRIKDAATPFVGRKIDDEMVEELTNVVDAVIDAGWPTGPELPKSSSNDVAHQDSQAAVVQEFDTVIKDAFKPYDSESKHTATDAVRALVMLHTDWNQAQIMRELESQGRVVGIGTIATVRSMTLATIAVAKGLGKWVEG